MANKLPREARLFGAVSLLNDFASEMVYPLLPALLTGLGAGPVALGALDGIADFVSALVKIGASGLNNDLHGSAEYRAHLVSVMASRAVTACA